MGDRALIHVHNGKELSPCVYLHWGGSSVAGLLEALEVQMAERTGDVPYATARLIGLAHERRPGNLSLGVWCADETLEALQAEPADYSHGDAGVFLVDCRDWSVVTFGGYGLKPK